MNRPKSVLPSLSASALQASPSAGATFPGRDASGIREYYLLRRYELRSGPQGDLARKYFETALLPAANRLGIRPVGVFETTAGSGSPGVYVLLPSTSLETLVSMDQRLSSDAAYAEAGGAFLNAPAVRPAYVRMESTLLAAFEGWPKLQVPSPLPGRGERVFELRTYECPSERDYRRKIAMFHSGEFDVFRRAGFQSVFYGDTLVGSRLPKLIYMLAFDGLANRSRLWDAFSADPEWKKLASAEQFAFEDIVCNISNAVLGPAPYSQV